MTIHVIYGLSLVYDTRNILYVGSIERAKYHDRIRMHQTGRVRTTKKMARRSGVCLENLRARVLRRWVSGEEASPEGRVTGLCRALGMARWNRPYTFSSEDSHRSGKSLAARPGYMASLRAKLPREVMQKGGRIAGRIVAGRPGYMAAMGRKVSREAHIKAGRAVRRETQVKGGRRSGHMNVESGRLASYRTAEHQCRAGRIGGKRRVELHGIPGTSESRSRGARRRNELYGNPRTHEGSVIGGRKGGRRLVETHVGIYAIEHEGLGNHIRWHVNRGIVNANCLLCTGEANAPR